MPRTRKPVRRDPHTGAELCHKKVDGFPCKFILGHTQGCDVDWNAAYPDEPDTPPVHLHGPVSGPVCGADWPEDRKRDTTAYRSHTTCTDCLATLT